MNKRKEDTALSDAELDTLFQAASDEVPLPSGELLARIARDAAANAPPPHPVFEPDLRSGFWSGLRETLGGWAGVSGLAGAAAIGLIIGVFPPDILSAYSEALIGGQMMSDYIPGEFEMSFDG